MRLAVRAAADHREDVARAGIDRHQRGLRLSVPLARGQALVDRRDTLGHGLLRETLQVQIECRVDFHPRASAEHALEVFFDLLAGVVDEVRRLVLDGPRRNHQRLGRGLAGVGVGDGAGVDHGAQHDVAPFARAFGIAERREPRRRLDEPGNRRRLGERQVADVLAEEDARRFRHAVYGKGAALAEHDVVQVQLEDLLLGEARLEHERHELFLQLAPHRLLGREECVLDDLLRERGRAFEIRPVATQVRDDGAHGANGIDARVIEEPPVLDGEHRVDDVFRQVRQRHVPSSFALGECGQQWRLEREVLDAILAGCRDARHRGRVAGRELDGERARRGVGCRSGDEGHGTFSEGELAGGTGRCPLRIAHIVEPLDELRRRQRLSAADLERTAVDARRGQLFTGELAVDDAPEGDPQGRGRDDADDEDRGADEQGVAGEGARARDSETDTRRSFRRCSTPGRRLS